MTYVMYQHYLSCSAYNIFYCYVTSKMNIPLSPSNNYKIGTPMNEVLVTADAHIMLKHLHTPISYMNYTWQRTYNLPHCY